MAQIKAILWDWDGTISNSEHTQRRAIDNAFWRFRTFFDFNSYYSEVKKLVTLANAANFLAESGRILCEPQEFIRILEEEYTEVSEKGLAVMPGVSELLNEADRRGVVSSIVSHSDLDYIKHDMSQLGLEGRFQAIVTPEQIPWASRKPAPDMFLEGARRTGVAAEECIAIGDSKNDILGAVAAGMRAVYVPDPIFGEEITFPYEGVITTHGLDRFTSETWMTLEGHSYGGRERSF